MSKVLISDILQPENWAGYGVQRVAELSALFQSGLVGQVDNLVLPSGGGTVNMPFFNDLTGDAQNLSDSVPLTVNGIGTDKDVSVVIGRGNAWSVNDLAAVLSGADPYKAVMDLIAGWWVRQLQKETIQVLSGVFAAASMAALQHDISAETAAADNSFNQNTFIDATQLLGDAKDIVSAVVMHSAVEAYLAKQQLIVYETTADKTQRVLSYMGKRVIVDDGVPVSGGVYTTYIFGAGALGYTEDDIGDNDIETDRDILAGDSVATMRRRFILHPRGIKWTGTAAGAFPTRAELATGTNWERVYETKKIRMIEFKHKIS